MSQDVIADGLAVIRRLSSPDAWRASCGDHAEAEVARASELLEALAAAVPDGKPHERRFHDALRALRAALADWSGDRRELPAPVERAALACRMPLLVRDERARTDDDAPRWVGLHRPVRAMAVGGGNTEVYPGADELGPALEAILAELVRDARAACAYVIDLRGALLGAAGEPESYDPLVTSEAVARSVEAPGALAALERERELVVHADGTFVLVRVVGSRGILTLIAPTAHSSPALARICAQDVEPRLAALLQHLPAATDEALRALFVES